MKSKLPKTLHTLGGLPLINHLYMMLKTAGGREPCLVTAPSMHEVREQSMFQVHAVQEKPLGTGNAVLSAEKEIEAAQSDVLILCGDTPLIQPETIKASISALQQHDVVILGMRVAEDNTYGRIFLDDEGCVEKIVEAVDCADSNIDTDLCNSGIVVVKHQHILPLLKKIKKDAKSGEYYLTDIVQHARDEGLRIGMLEVDHEELLGVNTQHDLACAEYIFQTHMRHKFLEAGVTMVDPESVYFSYDTKVAPGVHIEPHVFFGLDVSIEAGVRVRAFSHLEGAKVANEASVGPFARLRPGTYVGEGARIGNFVEIKKSDIQSGAKVSHLSYVGDAEVGQNANIGAGTITCNYDGKSKHKTKIGEGAFIGSNTALVAPVAVGEGAMVGAGSTITEDVAPGDLSLTRAPQKTLKKWASKFFSSKKRKE